MKSFLYACALFVALFPSCAFAGYGGYEADVARAESYLRNLSTLQADFVQVDNSGARLSGTFYLDRPGKLRFEYDQTDDFIVADGMFIYFYDSALGEQSNAPIGQTMADFLLQEDLRLGGGITVTGVRKDSGFTHVNLVQTSDADAGSLRLVFQDDPYVLRMWRVVDAQGFITEVYLESVRTGVDLPSDLFVYADPSRKVERYNQ